MRAEDRLPNAISYEELLAAAPPDDWPRSRRTTPLRAGTTGAGRRPAPRHRGLHSIGHGDAAQRPRLGPPWPPRWRLHQVALDGNRADPDDARHAAACADDPGPMQARTAGLRSPHQGDAGGAAVAEDRALPDGSTPSTRRATDVAGGARSELGSVETGPRSAARRAQHRPRHVARGRRRASSCSSEGEPGARPPGSSAATNDERSVDPSRIRRAPVTTIDPEGYVQTSTAPAIKSGGEWIPSTSRTTRPPCGGRSPCASSLVQEPAACARLRPEPDGSRDPPTTSPRGCAASVEHRERAGVACCASASRAPAAGCPGSDAGRDERRRQALDRFRPSSSSVRRDLISRPASPSPGLPSALQVIDGVIETSACTDFRSPEKTHGEDAGRYRNRAPDRRRARRIRGVEGL